MTRRDATIPVRCQGDVVSPDNVQGAMSVNDVDVKPLVACLLSLDQGNHAPQD